MRERTAPAAKSVVLAIGVEAHDLRAAIALLREIEFRLLEAIAHGDVVLDITSGSGWHMTGDIDHSRTEEAYTTELMEWFERRKASRREESSR